MNCLIEVIASNKGNVSKNSAMSRKLTDNLNSKETSSQKTERKRLFHFLNGTQSK